MADEQDQLLPIANVGRIMKQILPANAKISKEAKQTMQECATEFISFVTSEASAKCHKENRKTVNGDDICWALSTLGLDNYAETVLRYLHKYRLAEMERSNHKKASTSYNQEKGQDQSNSAVLPCVQETDSSVRFTEFLDKNKNCNSPLRKPS